MRVIGCQKGVQIASLCLLQFWCRKSNFWISFSFVWLWHIEFLFLSILLLSHHFYLFLLKYFSLFLSFACLSSCQFSFCFTVSSLACFLYSSLNCHNFCLFLFFIFFMSFPLFCLLFSSFSCSSCFLSESIFIFLHLFTYTCLAFNSNQEYWFTVSDCFPVVFL